ncbi:BatD family protein [Tropicimonas marinistellae]|uniref:BatD family protein n=1 Tax=Tropicimonas marinistellae TaxID=1739787 RepID=UPI0008314FF4|nr:BatD family protein [Tropicimonas marinistellae]
MNGVVVRSIGCAFGLCLWAMAIAQEAPVDDAPSAPLVSAELEPASVVVGQPAVLRLKVLVPTWLPQPPSFPALDLPNVITRLPERASGPISEQVGGETWSGVSRAYRLYPMVPGQIALPPQQIGVTYADPDTTQPVTAQVALDPIALTATVPEAAAGLDPMILATGLSLEQNIEGGEGPLSAGDAVVRSVTATIAGTSPLFLPPLIPDLNAEPVQAHAREPAVAEREDRGVMSGQRTETVTYVARYGGVVDLPAISVDWFNVDTGQVETAEVAGTTLTVDAPSPPREPRLTRRQVIALALAAGVLAAAAWLLRRFAWPPLRSYLSERRAAREASEAHAANGVRQAISAHDLHGVFTALDSWDARCPADAGKGTDEERRLAAALHSIGAAKYGGAPGPRDADWTALDAAFVAVRTARVHGPSGMDGTAALPPMNPT